MKVVIVGTGLLGLSTAVRFACDHQVICVDIDAKHIADLANGASGGLAADAYQSFTAHRERKRIRFTTNLQNAVCDADAVFIAYDEALSTEPLQATVSDVINGLTGDVALIIRTPLDFDDCLELRGYVDTRTNFVVDIVINPRIDDEDRRVLIGTYDSAGYRVCESLYMGGEHPCEVYNTDVVTAIIADSGMRILQMEYQRTLKHVVQLCEQQGGNVSALLNILKSMKK